MHVVIGNQSFRLRAVRERESRSVLFSVITEDGTVLGDVMALEEGAVRQLPTEPPVGLQLIAIR